MVKIFRRQKNAVTQSDNESEVPEEYGKGFLLKFEKD